MTLCSSSEELAVLKSRVFWSFISTIGHKRMQSFLSEVSQQKLGPFRLGLEYSQHQLQIALAGNSDSGKDHKEV